MVFYVFLFLFGQKQSKNKNMAWMPESSNMYVENTYLKSNNTTCQFLFVYRISFSFTWMLQRKRRREFGKKKSHENIVLSNFKRTERWKQKKRKKKIKLEVVKSKVKRQTNEKLFVMLNHIYTISQHNTIHIYVLCANRQ